MIQDAGEEKVVLVTPNGINNPVEIEANSWNLPRMLALIYIFPESWEEPPRVYLLGEDWQNSFVVGSNIELNGGSTYAPPVFYKHIEERDIIFIESSDGELRRRQEMLPIGERSIEFLPPGDPILSRLPKNVLWDLLFSD